MKLLGIAVGCLLFTANASKLDGRCEGDNESPNFIVEIPHPDEKTASLLYLHAGTCDQTSFEQFGGSLVYNDSSLTVEITIPVVACGIREVDFGVYQAKANVTLGANINGLEIVFKNVLVRAECGVKTTYQVGYEYQGITTADDENQDCQKIDGTCVFPSYDDNVVLEIKEYMVVFLKCH